MGFSWPLTIEGVNDGDCVESGDEGVFDDDDDDEDMWGGGWFRPGRHHRRGRRGRRGRFGRF